MIVEYERGLGLTTRQILAAPVDAVYVALNPTNVLYVRRLAEHLQRTDLKVVSPNWLALHWRGLKGHIVVDHAVTIEAVSRGEGRQQWHRMLHHIGDRVIVTLPDGP